MIADPEIFFVLANKLSSCKSDQERLKLLEKPLPKAIDLLLSVKDQLILKSILVINQGHLFYPFDKNQIKNLLKDLYPIESFYQSIGGIVGYHATMLSLFANHTLSHEHKSYEQPECIDIAQEDSSTCKYTLQGLYALPYLAEIYPVGGAADRLQLMDPVTHASLPAAKLELCGRSLLEGLIRDLQAKEYLYFKLFGKQLTTPIAMMTSEEKDNHLHVLFICEQNKWFGRSQACFRFFQQPLVPALNIQGKWLQTQNNRILRKPGGHGMLWKTAIEQKIFTWFTSQGYTKILVRQINNPVASVDYGLLAFSGIGYQKNKQFGFASCLRLLEAAEGINVLCVNEKKQYCLTNIEYCDFEKYQMKDFPLKKGSSDSRFFSNTNILFADVKAIEEVTKKCPIPGMLVNQKKTCFINKKGHLEECEIARLESMMQNIAECFSATQIEELGSFLSYNLRHKTISTVKKKSTKTSSLLETPEGCFYDILYNGYDLLKNRCDFSLPAFSSHQEYITKGPSILFQYHPALGPLYTIIAQKIQSGQMTWGSELRLEIAEVQLENLYLDGVLHIMAERVIGHYLEDRLVYSQQIGRCRLSNVRIKNQGIDRSSSNIYWRDQISYHQKCKITLKGNSYFIAENVEFTEDIHIEVEDGICLQAFQEKDQVILQKRPLISSEGIWNYKIEEDTIALQETGALSESL
ncbi:UTP--glucose-1-phosphate uridylyltransferase [Candidatus Rhabdochlamydia oedothoracis]|uniref:UTP--glucose-1-phosphate uridylyltransferase n=1 Tax=Candidatus Rhabdochlamydia oedothoracis TaxID=2720720 RepID=A0ABX8UZL0_9BACT|nr:MULTISPECIES: UTP--glucose-1-phosphate uridylyltransferase [Rhabdochlamydia]KAG6559560.1 putative uridylyltransferase [Candidatus Rhabdochlamydia sp. W815]QYF48404.1 UTP--glucose-1-phosphate uridylyltransferase [Candidatus Rhabdochlamydia oedothoracis]